MDLFKGAEKLMGMSNSDWARHANPWSVYTRFAASVPMFFALWSVYWIGWWATLPIALMVLWTAVNPRFFKPPRSTSSWGARGVLGERAFLNREQIPIPREHHRFAIIATTFSTLFMGVALWGYIDKNFLAAFAGWHASVLAKAWFVDRTAWLWEDMKSKNEIYSAWNAAQWEVSLPPEKA